MLLYIDDMDVSPVFESDWAFGEYNEYGHWCDFKQNADNHKLRNLSYGRDLSDKDLRWVKFVFSILVGVYLLVELHVSYKGS